jgi:phosphoribosylglycinamide formyltransferase 2
VADKRTNGEYEAHKKMIMRDELARPLFCDSYKMMLLGSGELAKEIAIEAQRLGVKVTAVDRYPNAPAMQVAHNNIVVNMLDYASLNDAISRAQPDVIVPEIEAINIDALRNAEKMGFKVVPNAEAVGITMNRIKLRRLAHEELGLPTAEYRTAETAEGLKYAVDQIGYPCVVKPIMSSSGHGQAIVRSDRDVSFAWEKAKKEARGEASHLIVEEHVNFDHEVTELTLRHSGEGGRTATSYCPLIESFHTERGDYCQSIQPFEVDKEVLEKAHLISKKLTDRLGGLGVFGVELFIKEREVLFSECSPRPHDTGLLTVVSQNQSEFELHVRAIAELPIASIEMIHPAAASHVILAERDSSAPKIKGLSKALSIPSVKILLFGKPSSYPHRRMGVALAYGKDPEEARTRAIGAARAIEIL